MQNAHSAWDTFIVENFPRKSMRFITNSINHNSAISVHVAITSPKPTSACFMDKFRKSFDVVFFKHKNLITQLLNNYQRGNSGLLA